MADIKPAELRFHLPGWGGPDRARAAIFQTGWAVVKNGRLLPPEGLRQAFASGGVDLDKPTMTSCGSLAGNMDAKLAVWAPWM